MILLLLYQENTESEKSLKLLKTIKQVYMYIHTVAHNFVHQLIKLAFLLGWISSGSTTTVRTIRLERKEKKNETPQQNNLQLILIVIVIVLVIILVMLAISVPLT